MRDLLLALSLGVLSTPAQAQAPVTPADLVGSAIEASIVNDRVMRRDGQDRPQKHQADWKIVFVSEDSIRPSLQITVRTRRGVHKGPQEGGRLVALERSMEISSRGGGHRVWFFDAGVLTVLRTYEGGGMKSTFAVSRSEAGFNCTANMSWPREVGVPNVVLRSLIKDAKVEIVSAKQTASSCKVTKSASAAAPAER